MSVLVKGMEIPKDCPYCKMAYYNASDEFTGCAVVPDKKYAMHNDAVYANSTQRPDWCPLVEIPAHGRLIDADVVIEKVMNYCVDDDGSCVEASADIRELLDEIENLPTIQPEPQEGHWIPHESPDGGEQYECSRCGVLWEFNDGTPEDNEAYFCPKCGKKLITK